MIIYTSFDSNERALAVVHIISIVVCILDDVYILKRYNYFEEAMCYTMLEYDGSAIQRLGDELASRRLYMILSLGKDVFRGTKAPINSVIVI